MGKWKWDLESVREAAKGKTAKQLHSEVKGAYEWARRNGKLKEIGFITHDTRYEIEKVKFLAEGLSHKVFQKYYPDMYNWANKTGNLSSIGLKNESPSRWNLEKVKILADGQRSGDFKREHKSAYEWAQRNGLLGKLNLDSYKYSHMNQWGKELAEDMELSYSTEYSDPSCKDKIILRFDLAIHDHYEVKCLVEFQGRQHYDAIELFGGEEKLADQQKKDQIKRDWCAANSIPLIEIDYSFKDAGEQAFKDELRRQLKSVGIC